MALTYSFPNFEPVRCIRSGSNCCFITCIRFLRRQVRWSGTPISLRIFHSLLWSTQSKFSTVSETESNVFLEFFCFFYDPMFVGNLISCSSAFSKSSLNILSSQFTYCELLKPGLENFEHYFACVWDECNCAVVWTFFGIGMKAALFQSCGHCWVFQICWHIECSIFIASSFRIWKSSTGIPSPPLAFFIVMLPKAHLTSHFRMSCSRWGIMPLWLSGSWRSF